MLFSHDATQNIPIPVVGERWEVGGSSALPKEIISSGKTGLHDVIFEDFFFHFTFLIGSENTLANNERGFAICFSHHLFERRHCEGLSNLAGCVHQ